MCFHFLYYFYFNLVGINQKYMLLTYFQSTADLVIKKTHSKMTLDEFFKGCVHYIFTSLFFKSKGEHLENKDKCFLFHFKSSFHSQENQILEF